MITRISNATSKSTVSKGIVSNGAKAAFDKRINNNNWGIINGKPKTAMMAAFCCALAAIAARKEKIRLRLQPPSNTSPINGAAF
jgi:hypothetical protein